VFPRLIASSLGLSSHPRLRKNSAHIARFWAHDASLSFYPAPVQPVECTQLLDDHVNGVSPRLVSVRSLSLHPGCLSVWQQNLGSRAWKSRDAAGAGSSLDWRGDATQIAEGRVYDHFRRVTSSRRCWMQVAPLSIRCDHHRISLLVRKLISRRRQRQQLQQPVKSNRTAGNASVHTDLCLWMCVEWVHGVCVAVLLRWRLQAALRALESHPRTQKETSAERE
jgi:hypothetical protein